MLVISWNSRIKTTGHVGGVLRNKMEWIPENVASGIPCQEILAKQVTAPVQRDPWPSPAARDSAKTSRLFHGKHIRTWEPLKNRSPFACTLPPTT